jgi:hypothetical protein
MMVSISKKVAKEVTFLAAKWAAKYGSRVYGDMLNYKISAEMAIIPRKIAGKILTKSTRQALSSLPTYLSTFAILPEMFASGEQLMKEIKELTAAAGTREQKQKLAPIILKKVRRHLDSYHGKLKLQFFIDTIQLIIPIPFSGWS